MPLNDGGPALAGYFTYTVKQSDKFHMTGKPTPLMVDILEIVKEGGTVLDPFMGSGTTGVACVQTGRGFIGVEKDVSYFEVACKRIEQTQAQPNLFIHRAQPNTALQATLLRFAPQRA